MDTECERCRAEGETIPAAYTVTLTTGETVAVCDTHLDILVEDHPTATHSMIR